MNQKSITPSSQHALGLLCRGSAAISRHKVAYITALDGGELDGSAAANTTAACGLVPLYLVEEACGGDGNTMRLVERGQATGLDTSGGATGDPVYLSTAGGVTLTRPTGSAVKRVVGRVTKVSADTTLNTWLFDASSEGVAGGLAEEAPATVANGGAGIPIVYRITVATGTGNTDVTVTRKIRVFKVEAIKTSTAGGAGDQVIIQNAANAITSALDLNVSDKVVVSTDGGTIDDAYYEIAAGGTLRVAATAATNCACEVLVYALLVA